MSSAPASRDFYPPTSASQSSFRRRVAGVLDRYGVLARVAALRARAPSPWLTVVTYHRATDSAGTRTLFDSGAADVTPSAFDRHLEYVKRHFSVVCMGDVLRFLRGGPLPHNPLLITFDDGYLDNHDVVMPLLSKHGLTAVFFVATSFVDERRLFWWDRVNYTIKRSTRDEARIEYPEAERWPLTREEDRQAAIARALSWIKERRGLDLPRFLDHLAHACDVDLSPAEERRLADGLVMTWDHLRALRRAGMDVQSHTHRHRVLQTLTAGELDDELARSRRRLEDELGGSVRAVSYPIGLPLREPRLREAVRAAGYEVGFTSGTGTNLVWRLDRWNARRLSVDLDDDDAAFRAMVTLPYFAASHH